MNNGIKPEFITAWRSLTPTPRKVFEAALVLVCAREYEYWESPTFTVQDLINETDIGQFVSKKTNLRPHIQTLLNKSLLEKKGRKEKYTNGAGRPCYTSTYKFPISVEKLQTLDEDIFLQVEQEKKAAAETKKRKRYLDTDSWREKHEGLSEDIENAFSKAVGLGDIEAAERMRQAQIKQLERAQATLLRMDAVAGNHAKVA